VDSPPPGRHRRGGRRAPDFLVEQDAGTPRGLADYLQQLIAHDGAGALAQGYYGLLNLSAYLLPLAAEQEGVAPRELLTRIGLAAAADPEQPDG
jgi:hypothetical protein